MVFKAASLFDQGLDCAVEANAGKYPPPNSPSKPATPPCSPLGGMGYAPGIPRPSAFSAKLLIPRTAPSAPT